MSLFEPYLGQMTERTRLSSSTTEITVFTGTKGMKELVIASVYCQMHNHPTLTLNTYCAKPYHTLSDYSGLHVRLYPIVPP